jgi:hypothetical protein
MIAQESNHFGCSHKDLWALVKVCYQCNPKLKGNA